MEPLEPKRPNSLEQRLRSQDVRPYEAPGLQYGKAVVRLCREVHDNVHLVLAERVRDLLLVGDVE